MIIYGWQQLEGIKENVLRLVASDTRRDRRIISQKIQDDANDKRLTRVEMRQIYNCLARKGHCLFNSIDDWLKIVSDQPMDGGYSECVVAESHSIYH